MLGKESPNELDSRKGKQLCNILYVVILPYTQPWKHISRIGISSINKKKKSSSRIFFCFIPGDKIGLCALYKQNRIRTSALGSRSFRLSAGARK